MRWFKHLTRSHEDENLCKIIDRFGIEGYGIYWIILERIAGNMDGTETPSLEISIRNWSKSVGISPKKLQNFVRFSADLGCFVAIFSGHTLRIECPKLLKYKDEYARKSGHKQASCPDNIPKQSETETETEDIISIPAPNGPGERKPDPLKPYPGLVAAYPKIRAAILRAHPKAKLPTEGTPAEIEDRRELERLIRIDGYTEMAVLDCLGWLFKESHQDALFWRQQVQSLGSLRIRKKKETLHKFDKIAEKWRLATADNNGHYADGKSAETAMLSLFEEHANGNV